MHSDGFRLHARFVVLFDCSLVLIVCFVGSVCWYRLGFPCSGLALDLVFFDRLRRSSGLVLVRFRLFVCLVRSV